MAPKERTAGPEVVKDSGEVLASALSNTLISWLVAELWGQFPHIFSSSGYSQ